MKLKRSIIFLLTVCMVIAFKGIHIKAYTTENVDLRVLLNATYYEANPNGDTFAVSLVNTAKYPFAQKWNVIFNSSYVIVGALPVELCPLSNNTHCTLADCGGDASSCTNSTSNNIHHKNITKNLNVIKTSFSVYPYDLMTTFIGTYACAKNGSSHIYPAGMSDVSGDYSICTFVSSATTTFKVRVFQHELSHNFGCTHCGGYSTGVCIMKGSYDQNSSQLPDIWCSYCESNFNRTLH